jgi:hypothetical protein
MNGKDLEGMCSSLIEEISRHLLGRTEKNYEKPQDALTEIRTEHLPNTNQERYRYAIPFGVSVSIRHKFAYTSAMIFSLHETSYTWLNKDCNNLLIRVKPCL